MKNTMKNTMFLHKLRLSTLKPIANPLDFNSQSASNSQMTKQEVYEYLTLKKEIDDAKNNITKISNRILVYPWLGGHAVGLCLIGSNCLGLCEEGNDMDMFVTILALGFIIPTIPAIVGSIYKAIMNYRINNHSYRFRELTRKFETDEMTRKVMQLSKHD